MATGKSLEKHMKRRCYNELRTQYGKFLILILLLIIIISD